MMGVCCPPLPVSGVSLANTTPMHAHCDPLLLERSEQNSFAKNSLAADAYTRK